MPHWVQTSDWSDYDSRKIAYDDRFNFSCEETWEVDYLVNKIRNFNRDKPEAAIRQAIESCGKCTPCRIGSVRGVEVMDKIISGKDVGQNIKLVRDLSDTMLNGSLCALGGMTPYPVLSAMNHFAEDFENRS